MSGRWTYFLRGYYADNVKPPKQPGELAIEIGGQSEGALSADRAVLEERDDIGEIELLGPCWPPRNRP